MGLHTRKAGVIGFGAALMLTAYVALADSEDLRAMAKAKITLIEAIESAESAEGGKAFEAGIDDDSFQPEFEVSISRDGRVYDVRVNAETGEVIGVREDKDD